MFILTLEKDGKNIRYDVKKSRFLIGRAEFCDIILPYDFISRKHCLIYLEAEPLRCYVMDGDIFGLRSKFGVHVNGQRVFRYQLHDGDVITFARGSINPSIRFIDLSPNQEEFITGEFQYSC
jgi:pSer/pThr/pTyr-binding forkhead associated (FHA) protein